MYQTVIDIKNSVQGDTLRKLQFLVENAFSNRAGKVANVSNEPHRFVFEGDENDYGCLEVGMLTLKRIESFLEYVNSWKWIEDDPDECCDMLRVFSTPVR